MLRHLDPRGSNEKASSLAILLLRMAVSTVLIWGALTKLVDDQRLAEIREAWASAGVPQADTFLGLSIIVQLVLALLLLAGLFTRTAGLLNAVNFGCAVAITGIFTAGSNWWPFALMIVLLLHFGVLGAGKFSMDASRLRRAVSQPPRQQSIDEIMRSIGIKPREGGDSSGQRDSH